MDNKISQPLVSIILPVYNAEKFLSTSINSILNQTYSNWELIAVDDGSIDKSWKILKTYAKDNKKIKVYRNRKNLGIGTTLNFMIGLTKGVFIARMDADDIAEPQRIEKQVTFLIDNPDIGIIGGYMKEIDENEKIIAIRKVPLTHQDIAANLMTSQTIQNPTLMINRTLIPKDQLYFNPELSYVDELDFFFRNLPNTKFANLPEILMTYRRHGNNSSLKNIKSTFSKTWKVRMKAILQYGYRTNLTQYILSLIQYVIVKTLPQSFLYTLFLWWKGHKSNGNFTVPKIETISTKKNCSLSLVIPVYKGESFIKNNVLQTLHHLNEERIKFELIVVVDGIVDRTNQILRNLQISYPELKVIEYKINRGKGYAVRKGFAKAKYSYIGFMDAGFDIEYGSLHNMLQEIKRETKYDGFIADKTHELSVIQTPIIRRVYSKGFITLVNLLLNSSFRDTQTGLKIFKKSVIKKALSNLKFNGYSFDVELLAYIKKTNLLYCPVIIIKDFNKSNVAVKDMVQMAVDVFKISISYYKKSIKDKIGFIDNLLAKPLRTILRNVVYSQ